MFFKKKSEKTGKQIWEDFFKALLKQEFPKALAHLNALKEVEPNNSQVHMKIGDVLQRTGDIQNAVASYHTAAAMLTKEGFGHKAIAIYKIILRLKPNEPEATKFTKNILSELESSKTSISSALASSEAMAEGIPSFAEQAASEPGTWGAPATQAEETPFEAPQEEAPQEAPFEAPSEEMPQWTMPEEQKEFEAPQGEEPPQGEGVPQWSADNPPSWESPQPEEEKPGEAGGWPSSAESFEEPSKQLSVIPPIFASLSKEDLDSMLRSAEVKSFVNGKAVVEEGDSGNSMFIIKKGQARVVSHILGKTFDLARLKEGDVFGEVAFLTGRPRTASVYADGDLEVLDIDRSSLQDVLDNNPQILDALVKFYYSRVQDTLKKIKP